MYRSPVLSQRLILQRFDLFSNLLAWISRWTNSQVGGDGVQVRLLQCIPFYYNGDGMTGSGINKPHKALTVCIIIYTWIVGYLYGSISVHKHTPFDLCYKTYWYMLDVCRMLPVSGMLFPYYVKYPVSSHSLQWNVEDRDRPKAGIAIVSYQAPSWYKWHINTQRPSCYPLIIRFMGPTWGPSGADRTQVGLAPWTLLSGSFCNRSGLIIWCAKRNVYWLPFRCILTSLQYFCHQSLTLCKMIYLHYSSSFNFVPKLVLGLIWMICSTYFPFSVDEVLTIQLNVCATIYV